MSIKIGLGIPQQTGGASGPVIPANAIQQRDGSYILDRATDYIEAR